MYKGDKYLINKDKKNKNCYIHISKASSLFFDRYVCRINNKKRGPKPMICNVHVQSHDLSEPDVYIYGSGTITSVRTGIVCKATGQWLIGTYPAYIGRQHRYAYVTM